MYEAPRPRTATVLWEECLGLTESDLQGAHWYLLYWQQRNEPGMNNRGNKGPQRWPNVDEEV